MGWTNLPRVLAPSVVLTPGTRLGHYEILAPLGVGGMGEVYRAHDPRLGRDVAVKVLPQHLTASSEDRARFKREAKTISSLNHPHICVLQYERPARIREYLESCGLMESKEKEALAAVYGLLSETGGHPYMARSEQVRLLRHLALTFCQFALLRMKGYQSST